MCSPLAWNIEDHVLEFLTHFPCESTHSFGNTACFLEVVKYAELVVTDRRHEVPHFICGDDAFTVYGLTRSLVGHDKTTV